jgi:predicted TPR repeat methyltransferase
MAIEPQWAKARARAAQALLRMHSFAAAAQHYRMALKLEPANQDYQKGLQVSHQIIYKMK